MVDLGLPSRSSGSKYHTRCPVLFELSEETHVTLESMGNCGVELRLNPMRRSLTVKQYKFNAEEIESHRRLLGRSVMVQVVRSIRLRASVPRMGR